MDGKATQILSIQKQSKNASKNASKYVLNSDNLHHLLDPIKDKKVAVISIAGPSRTGKSFLLSYMIRYLSNPLDINWIGKPDDPLNGFGWKTDMDPQTSGIWLSKPFIVKQSNEEEIAVLLMDTQGVFDEFSTQRDWSTFVGIGLLSSSCLIFNIFNNLQEDMLMVLESFLQYGLLAAKMNNSSESETPFQSLVCILSLRKGAVPLRIDFIRIILMNWNKNNSYLDKYTDFRKMALLSISNLFLKTRLTSLISEIIDQYPNNDFYFIFFKMFLIRDWNIPAQCNYGLTGGKKFLDRKLKVKENQPTSSQTARRLMKRCFKDVSCYLMPDPGDQAKEDLEFNGSVAQMNSRFVYKMKEFITYILNPDELKPKIMNNSNLTAKELCVYLETFAKIFNSDELPKPIDIVEATAKTADLIQIDKLKDVFLNEMRIYLQTKPFIERRNLEKHKNLNINAILIKFKGLKKTTNEGIEEELYELLNKNLSSIYEQIFNENEQRRERTLTGSVESCCNLFKRIMSDELESIFVDTFVLDQLFRHEKKKVIEVFADDCGEEEENLIATFHLKLTRFIENCGTEFRSENYRRIAEAEKNYTIAINDLIESYKKSLKSVLDRNVFLNKEQFNLREEEIRMNVRQEFRDNCFSGGSKFIEKFELLLEQKLNEAKSELKSLSRTNNDNIIFNTKNESNISLTNYNIEMKEIFNNIRSEEELTENHEDIKNKIIDQFNGNCLYKDEVFLKPYLEEIEKEINKSFAAFKLDFSKEIEKVLNTYKNAVKECKDLYIKNSELMFSGGEFYSEEELKNLHENNREDAILHFKSITNSFNFIDNHKFLKQIEESIDEEFIKIHQNNKLRASLVEKDLGIKTNDFLIEYEEKMEESLELVDSQSELMSIHEEVKKDIFEEFKKLNPFLDRSLFDPYLKTLEEMINKSLEDSIELLELELKNQASIAKNLVLDIRKFYREEMNKYYQKANFYSIEKLQNFNSSVVNLTINKFDTERGNMCSEKLEKLVTDSLKDIYIEIKEKNAMNAPTMTAIGIDLGTTNSCVAYYKPDRNNGTSIVIPNELGRNTTASVVAITNSEEIVGDVAREQAYVYPHNTIFLAKRLIGRKFDDILVQKDMKLWSYKVVDDGNNNPLFSVKVQGKDETYFPEQISAKVLKKMKEIAENHLGCKVTKAVITVPAYFNDSQKEATKDAGRIAGLDVMKIINEPTAAAIAFKLNRNNDENSRKVLIYDFGGGTFDVAVLVIDRGNIDIKAVGGDNHLGGDDFDSNIVNYCLDEFYRETGLRVEKSPDQYKALRRLRTNCEEHKCNLSSAESTTISIDNFFDSKDLRVVLTRDKFEELNEDLFVKSMDLVRKTLKDANLNNSEIDDVVLVGGSTRIIRIQKMLSSFFGDKPLNHMINPDEAVAIGAAIQAAILNGDQAQNLRHLKVSDVSPMTLGIKILGGFMSAIIPRNSKVPTTRTQQYITAKDYQTSTDLKIYEGEEEMVENNNLLGKFVLSGIPSARKGEEKINVTFDINDEGILHVKAKIESTGGENEVEINEHKGRLTDKELQELIDKEK